MDSYKVVFTTNNKVVIIAEDKQYRVCADSSKDHAEPREDYVDGMQVLESFPILNPVILRELFRKRLPIECADTFRKACADVQKAIRVHTPRTKWKSLRGRSDEELILAGLALPNASKDTLEKNLVFIKEEYESSEEEESSSSEEESHRVCV